MVDDLRFEIHDLPFQDVQKAYTIWDNLIADYSPDSGWANMLAESSPDAGFLFYINTVIVYTARFTSSLNNASF